MNLGINNYQCNTNFGCNKIRLYKLDINDKKQLLKSLVHETPKHSAVDFYKNIGFKPYETSPNGLNIYCPTSFKEMEEVIAKDAKG